MTKPKFWDDYPEEIKKRAIINFNNCTDPHKDFDSLKNAFLWYSTIEGDDFWSKVNNGEYEAAMSLIDNQCCFTKPIKDERVTITQHYEDLQIENEELKAENEKLKADIVELKRIIKHELDRERLRLWIDVVCSVANASNTKYEESMTTFADYFLAEFDKRFKSHYK
jgi:hypothetical protein